MDDFTPINNCRVCGHNFFKEPLLKYENMPKAAQFLPESDSLENDKGINLEICQCSGCGLVQLNNHPVPYYKEVIRASAVSEEMKIFRKKQFNDFVHNYSLKNKKIIEIGCGKGEFLSIMQEFIEESYGLEYSEASVTQCNKNGMRVYSGFIENADNTLHKSPFDAFFILNFLEHLPEPNTVLRGIYNNLTENGIGLIEVPNFDMIMQKKLFSEFMSDHLLYFDKETLNSTLSINGFDLLECEVKWYGYIISAVVKKKKKANLSDFQIHQSKLQNDVEKYLSCYKGKKVAIWGASHQALAILSLLDFSNKIEYVIDSAVFKQDKFTPATHIPIVAPEKLHTEPVDAVIVIAAGYSDEVARIIRQKFSKNINISILRNLGLEIIES
jgi:2-polyprenyl-3-methyl-5-hydroxy-6-metoxy-1,4-benzoquinol methylase